MLILSTMVTTRWYGLLQGLVNVPIEHHPTIGHIISDRYLFWWCWKSPKSDINPKPCYPPVCNWCSGASTRSCQVPLIQHRCYPTNYRDKESFFYHPIPIFGNALKDAVKIRKVFPGSWLVRWYLQIFSTYVQVSNFSIYDFGFL